MTSINIILKHGFTRGSFSLLKHSRVSDKLLTSFYGHTRKSRERIKSRKVFCNIFGFSLNLRSQLWKFLWFHPLSVCLPACLSVCLSVCLFRIFLRNHSLDFLHDASGQFSETERARFLMENYHLSILIIWFF